MRMILALSGALLWQFDFFLSKDRSHCVGSPHLEIFRSSFIRVD